MVSKSSVSNRRTQKPERTPNKEWHNRRLLSKLRPSKELLPRLKSLKPWRWPSNRPLKKLTNRDLPPRLNLNQTNSSLLSKRQRRELKKHLKRSTRKKRLSSKRNLLKRKMLDKRRLSKMNNMRCKLSKQRLIENNKKFL